MTHQFFDVELGLQALLVEQGYNAKLYVPDDPGDQVVWIVKIGGTRVGPFDRAAVQINVIGNSRSACHDTSEEIFNFLLSDSHWVDTVVDGEEVKGLIDRVFSEGSTPLELDFGDQYKHYSFTVAVETRALTF